MAAKKNRLEFRSLFDLFSPNGRQLNIDDLLGSSLNRQKLSPPGMGQSSLKSSYQKLLNDYKVPFVAQINESGGKYVVVSNINPHEVEIINGDRTEIRPRNAFLDTWTGIVMRVDSKGHISKKDFSHQTKFA